MRGRIKLSLIKITAVGIVLASCTTFSGPMLLVTEYVLVKDCELLQNVSTESGWGGWEHTFLGNAQAIGKRSVILNMLGAAEKAGGNVVFLQYLESGVWGTEGQGIAYDCPDLQFDNARKAKSTVIYGGKE